jgi:hypothetical protein
VNQINKMTYILIFVIAAAVVLSLLVTAPVVHAQNTAIPSVRLNALLKIDNHMTSPTSDPGAKESLQVCHDDNSRGFLLTYLGTNHLIVNGKKSLDVALEIVGNQLGI